MIKILMLALAPIRKNKGQSVNLFVFALIATMILNIGLALYFGINSFYDERAEANHSAHFSAIYYSGFDSIEQGQRFIENDTRVAEMERIDALGGMGDFYYDDIKTIGFIIISRLEAKQKIDAPSFMGQYFPLTDDGIYIPNFIFINNNYKIGDEFKLFIAGTEINFTIVGVTEEIVFGSKDGSRARFYITNEKYNDLVQQFPDNGITLLSARLENRSDSRTFQSDYNIEVSPDGVYRTLSYDEIKYSRILISLIIASIIMAFAIILVVVNLIVIRFRIINGIEEDMTNIGALLAVGYSSIQIITANVTQFGIVVLTGGVIGAVLAGVSIPVTAKIFEPMFALAWNPLFNISTALISIIFVLLTATLIVFLALRRINKLHPLTALRGGTTAHSFKKNFFPLDKSPGSLNFLLAFKQIIQNKKQSATVSIIVAAVTMVSIACFAVNDNISFRRDVFAYSAFGELVINDVIFTLKNGEDGESFKERLLEHPEIRKVIPFNMTGISDISILIDEVSTQAYIAEDFVLVESNMMIDGYYPRHDNEIALGTSTARETGKKTGDTVTARFGDMEKDYIVTGIFQCMQSNGRNNLMNAAGMRAIMPEFEITEFIVYVKDGVDVKDFAENVRAANEKLFDSILITHEYLGNIFDNLSGMFMAIAAGILAVTVFVVILTLYIVIKTIILRRRRELGIQKAVGFTTWQLMNQIALNIAPVILLGVFTGAIGGCFFFNPILVVLMSDMGIARINLPAPIDQIIVVCVVLVILSYAVSMLIAWRIRKISAYTLVSE